MMAVSAATVLRPIRRPTIYCSTPELVTDLNIVVKKEEQDETESFLVAYSLSEPIPTSKPKCRYVASPLEVDEYLTAFSL